LDFANLKSHQLDLQRIFEQFRCDNDQGWEIMLFSRGLFQDALHAISVNRPIALTFIAIQLLIQMFDEKLGHSSSGVQLILFSILAICIHQAVIKPERGALSFTDMGMMWSYGWRLLVMMVLSGGVAYVLSSLFSNPEGNWNLFLGFFAIFVLGLYSLVLSMWGTALPAVAVLGDAGLASATARGKRTFGYSALRLFFCCGPVFFIGFGVVLFLVRKFGIEGAEILGGPMGINAVPLTVGLIGSLFALFNTALASTILSRAYLIGEAKVSGVIA
jgi:hypothetical protein